MKEKYWKKYDSFGRTESGQIVTREKDLLVVYARNPYGRHNLVLVADHEDGPRAIRHGNETVLACLGLWLPRTRGGGLHRAFRRACHFLDNHDVRTNL